MTHPASTQAAAARLQSPPGSTVPCQATSKSNGRQTSVFCNDVLFITSILHPSLGVLHGGQCTPARLEAASFLVTLVTCSSWLSGYTEPDSTTTSMVAVPMGKSSTSHGWRIQGRATEHLSNPKEPPCLQGWMAQRQKAGSGGQAKLKTQNPESPSLQKSKSLKRFWEGLYKRRNLSP